RGARGSPSWPTTSRTSAGARLPGLDQEVIATVLLPARLVLLGAHRPLLAIRDDGDPAGLDPLRHQVVHRGLGAALTQRQVVLVCAALVAMPFDQHEHAVVAL